MQDRSEKYYSINKILEIFKNDTDVSVKYVSQVPHLNKETERGFCVGLGTAHLLGQLQSKKCIAKNPFDNSNTLQEARDMQIGYDHHVDANDHVGLLSQRDILEKELPLKDKKDRNTMRITSSYTELQDKLKNKAQKTKNDGIDRGIYIVGMVKRHPISGKKLDIGHCISMTIQKQDNELFCTGLDSNFFFAVGKGETGSNKVVSKVTDMLDAYDATDIYTYTNKKRS